MALAAGDSRSKLILLAVFVHEMYLNLGIELVVEEQ